MELLKLAWRNLWRNKKRTLITIASIFFGIIWAVLITSLQSGSFQNMVDNMVRFSSGHIQIQQEDYFNLKSINNSFVLSEADLHFTENLSSVSLVSPKIESFALASAGDKSYATAVVGVHPEKEKSLSNFSKWLTEGDYLETGQDGIVLGEVLARNLEVSVGDTLALIGQGFHGVNAAGLFPVRGILSFPLPDLNRQILYMNMESAQQLFELENRITSLALMVDRVSNIEDVIDQLNAQNISGTRVYSWDELLPELVSFIDGKESSTKLIKGLLFLLIAFGILATFIMMIAERSRELGIMIAIGMSRLKLSFILFLESILIGAMGILGGFMISLPIILYFVNHPIHVGGKVRETYINMGFEPVIMFSSEPDVFSGPAITIFVFSLIIAIYPIYSIIKLKIVKSLQA